jgi:Ca2+-binding EF-hand superfamily protein
LKESAQTFEKKAQSKQLNVDDKKIGIKREIHKLFEKATDGGRSTELDFNKAYKLIQELHKTTGTHPQTKEDFIQEFAKLDFDGDEKVTEEELINYELRQLYCQEILLIGICWVGHTINEHTKDPTSKECILLKEAKEDIGSEKSVDSD